jgi:hypothetical protein
MTFKIVKDDNADFLTRFKSTRPPEPLPDATYRLRIDIADYRDDATHDLLSVTCNAQGFQQTRKFPSTDRAARSQALSELLDQLKLCIVANDEQGPMDIEPLYDEPDDEVGGDDDEVGGDNDD